MRFARNTLILLGSLASSMHGEPPPEPFNTEKSTFSPLPPSQAASEWKLPPGFRATAFASEPDVRQPIASCLDDKGRLWVAESYMYAGHIGGYYEEKLRDRILILEDTDHDGVHDKRTVFAEGLERLTSIEVGLGGVWALTLPRMVFIPDKNRDDIPDGPPAPLLDGFDAKKSAHTMANGLRWGPDGWLYGRQGILGHSLVGKPGAGPEERKKMNVGIWRYHPIRQTFEVVAEGTTNPWGTDWDEHGELFFINTVIGHLWHVIPGAHYKRMFGEDYNPHIFGQIDQHADHVHWDTSEKWNEIRQGMSAESSSAGGGHAHTGLMIYLGDNWPEEYRKNLFTINFHGRRLNQEFIEPTGSGFTGRHRPDLAFSADPWFRGIDLFYGPDGGVFISDWSDTGECHDDDGIHRQSGRIYKITHGTPAPPEVGDVAALATVDLVSLLGHRNEWFARHARLNFQHRAAQGEDFTPILPALRDYLKSGDTTALKLRALWTLHSIGKADPALLTDLLSHPDAPLRVWAIRLLLDDPTSGNPAIFEALANLAAREASPSVRLALASALQRVPLASRAPIAAPLLRHAGDASDHNLPLMLWYGIEPLAGSHRAELATLAVTSEIPLVRENIARRLAMDPVDPGQVFDSLIRHAATAPLPWTLDLLNGLSKAFAGITSPAPPPSWPQLSAVISKSSDPSCLSLYRSLGTLFRDPTAIDATRSIISNENALPEARATALRSLSSIREASSLDLAKSLLGKPGLTPAAVERLALENDPSLPVFLLGKLPSLLPADQVPVVDALASRPTWASFLLDAIASGKLSASILSPFQVRQIRSLKAPELSEKITRLWGEVRDSGADKEAAIGQWKLFLTSKALSQADKPKGKQLFARFCGSCHKMYGEGGSVGPELTGSGRDNLDYLLANIIDPGAVVAKENQLSIINLKDGRVLSGMIRAGDDRTTSFQTLTEKITLPTADISEIETLPNSLMPEGLIDSLSREEVRDLIGWLMDKNPSASSAVPEKPVDLTIEGDWKIQVTTADGTDVTLNISPPAYRDVAGEEVPALPLYNPKGGGWNNGAKFAGNIAEVCSTPDLVDVSSVVLRPQGNPVAEPYIRGKDWEIEPSWGTFGRLDGGTIAPGAAVSASYRHTFLRIDSIVRLPDATLTVIQGSGTSAAPVPPPLPENAQRLANIWIPGPIPRLTENHLFPILETRPPDRQPTATIADRFPRLLGKLRAGEPVRILAWGDSVTAASYLPTADRWQEQLLARLRKKYPAAKIELLTEAWPGRSTVSYLGEAAGSQHNFAEKVLALRPDLVISEFVNDGSLPPESHPPAYQRILGDFQAIGADWIILTPHYIRPSWMGLTGEREIDDDPRPYVAFLRNFAAKHPVLLADASARYGRLWRQGLPFTSLMVNSVNHPNASGMTLFADTLDELFPAP